MSRAGVMKLVIVLLNLVLLLSKPALPSALTEVKCSKVVGMVTPCLDYVRDKEKEPSTECCDGTKALNAYCKTKKDRQDACECVKKAAGHMKIDVPRVLALPKKCGVVFYRYEINVDIDCKKIP